MSKRSFKEDKLAKVYDAEVVPIWSKRFGKMLLRDLTVPNKAMVLDVNCGSGYPSLEILKRMDEQGRIIAIDSSSPLLDEARTKAGKLSGKRIFFRSESQLPKLPFAEEVYDLVVANAGLQQLDDPEPAVRECARVTKVGGRVVATYPLAGTFGEFHDIFREVLVKGDYKDAIDRLDAYLTRYPPLEQAVAWFEDAGLSEIETEFESFTLLFKSSREFFFAPMIEYGPLASWKAVAGKGQQMQDVFWQTKAAIDAYFRGTSFSVTVSAGCVRGRKVERESPVQVAVPSAEPMKGARASSNPKPVSSSRPSGKGRAAEADLPDAPSDEVDALSGSWPVPVEELQAAEGSGLSMPKLDMSDFVEEIPTLSRDGFPRVAEPQDESGEEVEPADIVASEPSEMVELGTGDVELPELVVRDEDQLDTDGEGLREATGELQLSEIELVENSVMTRPESPKRKHRKPPPAGVPGPPDDPPDDPDDPEIL